mmetsp:Transcript_25398/g.54166  ORF Transcript_25398/g.54166 Transcript_25398/m.54166 type:complete len:193 (+) Transcript_25398:137-715(+)
MICVGGVCIPFSAVVPLLMYGIRWVFAKLHLYGMLPTFIAKMMNLQKASQPQQTTSSSCCNSGKDQTKSLTDDEQTCGTESEISSESAVVQELESIEQFNALLKKDKKVVVKFTADWCKPCKKIHPFFQERCAQKPEYDFVTVDVDEFDEIASIYSVAMMPTFIIVQGSSLVGTYRGSSEPELEMFLKKHLK